MSAAQSFTRHGPAVPAGPVVLAVPHAGRDYPLALRTALRVPLPALRALEDRHADTLALAALRGETLFVATRARAWIDLNRSEAERDPRVEDGAPVPGAPLSARLRSGLGLVPRHVPHVGEIWRRRLAPEEVAHRIATDHRPYHGAVAAALEAARARFGVAILLDVHSMPSLPGPNAARLVLGDRFGRSAAARIVERLAAVVESHGMRAALNAPYAGGHGLERHGNPARGIHAIQIEFDRALYLDARRDEPGDGLAATAALLRALIDAAADEALPKALAAE